MSTLAIYLFCDSVRVGTMGNGWMSGLLGYGHGGMWDTTSMGIVFVPFFLGIVALFYDAQRRWAWGLTVLGIAIVVIEVLSRIRFSFDMKLSYLLLLIVLFGAGVGLMLHSLKAVGTTRAEDPKTKDAS